MRIKKFLKQQAEKDLMALETEADREFLIRFKEAVKEEPPKKKRNLKWLWTIPSGIAVCAVAAVLIVELVPSSGNGLGDIKYSEDNFKLQESGLIELTGSLKNLTVRVDEDQVTSVIKTYDSVSGDDLYFTLNIDGALAGATYYLMEVRIIVNDNYKYDGLVVNEDFVTKTYPDYSISYTQDVIYDEETALTSVTCKAKIESAHYEIYVLNYLEYSSEGGTFLTVIDNLFDFHE